MTTRRLVEKTITVPGNLRRACEEFNSGRYFECHETLEEIWQEEGGPVRDLYKGLIQVAAAFVHLTRGNFAGANRLLDTGAGYLEPYRAVGALGVDVDAVCRAAEACLARARELGRERIREFDFSLAPVYVFDESLVAREAVSWGAWGFDAAGAAMPMTITVVE